MADWICALRRHVIQIVITRSGPIYIHAREVANAPKEKCGQNRMCLSALRFFNDGPEHAHVPTDIAQANIFLLRHTL